MKQFKCIVFLIFIIGVINGCVKYEDFNYTGNWQFHDKDNNYFEIYINDDSMYCESTDLFYWESEYYIEDNNIFFDSKTGYESAKKNRIKNLNDTCFRTRLKYTHLYSYGKTTETLVDEMDIELFRIDSSEFTLDMLMELTYDDSNWRSEKIKDYEYYMGQALKRKWIFFEKIFNSK